MKAPYMIGDPIPQVCLVKDCCRILQMSRGKFDQLLKEGRLPIVELERFGHTRRFSGRSVEAITRGRWAERRTA